MSAVGRRIRCFRIGLPAIAFFVLLPHAASAQNGAGTATSTVAEEAATKEGVATDPVHGMPMDHSTMDHSIDHSMDHPMDQPMDHASTPVGQAMPRTPIPVLTDADRVAAQPPPHDHPVHDNRIRHYTLIDRLETSNGDDGAALAWETRTWIGTDINRVWLRSEGERSDGRTVSADLEVLYGRSVATWWDVVAGVRHDFAPGGSRDFAAFGVRGVAPYKLEMNATAYIGQSGQTAARFEVEYETLLTSRLILQPRIEVNLSGRDDASRRIGSGLSTVEAGLRLRYEIDRRFAPYVGVAWEQAFGNTARFRRGTHDEDAGTRLVAGFRIWF